MRENPGRIPELLLVKFGVYWNFQVTPLNNLREGERLRVTDQRVVQIINDGTSQTGVTAANAAYQDDNLFNVIGRNLHIVYFGGLWLLAVGGAWLSRHDWRDVSLLFFVQISQTAVYLLFHPSTRYRSPTDPLLFVFSALAAGLACGNALAGAVDTCNPTKPAFPHLNYEGRERCLAKMHKHLHTSNICSTLAITS